jgi:antitoxin component YwqK of YwqJK toxin-antitoxin module
MSRIPTLLAYPDSRQRTKPIKQKQMRSIKLVILFISISSSLVHSQTSKSVTKIINGEVWKGYFVNGKPMGKWNVFNSDNKLIKEVTYLKGNAAVEKGFNHLGGIYWVTHCSVNNNAPFNLIANGSNTNFYESGKIYGIGYFKGGKGDGKFIYFSEAGDTLAVNYYKNGKHEGESTEFFEKTKKIKEHGYYKDDYKTGLWVEYYPNGQIRSQGEFFPKMRWLYNSLLNGKVLKDSLKRSMLDTTILSFPNAQYFKDGKWSYWSTDGHLYLEELWSEGKYLSAKKIR